MVGSVRMVKVTEVTAVVCIIFMSSLVLIPFVHADWAMFRSDPSRSGMGTGNEAINPTLLWNYTTGGNIESSPAVVHGIVYIGSFDGNVYALNAANGFKLWNYTTGKHDASSPAVVNGLVYIGTVNGHVYALGSTASLHASSSLLFIIVGVIVAVVIVVSVVFLMFRKRLKTMPQKDTSEAAGLMLKI